MQEFRRTICFNYEHFRVSIIFDMQYYLQSRALDILNSS